MINFTKNSRSLFVFLIASFILIFNNCFASNIPLLVTVSILPQKYFVEQIGGDHVKVTVMVKPNFDPEDYEPTPQQVKSLSSTQLYFAIGLPFEEPWLKRFQAVNPQIRIIFTQRGIEKMSMVFDDEGRQIDQSQGIKDPHIWLSPTLVRIQAINIRDALIQADPQHANDYRKGYTEFARQIQQVDNAILSTFANIPQTNNKFMVYHPAWGYFARDYGLQQMPIEIEGKSPSPRQFAQLIKSAQQQQIKIIFVQPQFSQKSAQTIAESIGGTVLAIDPLAENWKENLQKVAQTLKSSIMKQN